MSNNRCYQITKILIRVPAQLLNPLPDHRLATLDNKDMQTYQVGLQDNEYNLKNMISSKKKLLLDVTK